MLKNGIVWKDTQGNPLHAHGGYMIFHDGYYYWYGEDRRDNFYVSCYRSQNLTDWEFRNHILTTNSKMEGYRVRTTLMLTTEDGNKVNLERPKVLYNKKTNKFVMWAHFENGKNYLDAAVAIATSFQSIWLYVKRLHIVSGRGWNSVFYFRIERQCRSSCVSFIR